MKDRILAFVKLQSKLEGYCQKTDIALEQTARNINRETATVIEEMERLIDLKRKLVNLSVIYKEMADSVDAREMYIIGMSAAGDPLCVIAEELNVSTATAMRALSRIKNKCGRILSRYGIEQYDDILDRG